MNKKRWISLAVIVVLLVVYIRTDVLTEEKNETAAWKWGGYLNRLSSQPSFTIETYKEGIGRTIAILKLNGTIEDSNNTMASSIYNHQIFLKEIEDAFMNPEIKAIVLTVNSPGGGVYESDQIYQKLKRYKEIYQKPVIVYMGSMAASGGYYVSMPADKIIANKYTLTGSIGVIMATYNYSQLAEKLGIQEMIFKSGKNKDLLNPMRDINPEQMQIMQAMIDEYYGYFVDIVAQGRKMDRQAVIAVADGRVYTATQAKSLGLVDEIGDLDSAINVAAHMINETNPRVIQYQNENHLNLNWLWSLTSQFNLSKIKEDLQKSAVPTAMYLYR